MSSVTKKPSPYIRLKPVMSGPLLLLRPPSWESPWSGFCQPATEVEQHSGVSHNRSGLYHPYNRRDALEPSRKSVQLAGNNLVSVVRASVVEARPPTTCSDPPMVTVLLNDNYCAMIMVKRTETFVDSFQA